MDVCESTKAHSENQIHCNKNQKEAIWETALWFVGSVHRVKLSLIQHFGNTFFVESVERTFLGTVRPIVKNGISGDKNWKGAICETSL